MTDTGPSDRASEEAPARPTTDGEPLSPSDSPAQPRPPVDDPIGAAPPPADLEPPPPPPPADVAPPPADVAPPPAVEPASAGEPPSPPPPPAPVEAEPAETPAPAPPPGPPWKLIALLAVIAVALGIGAFLVGKADDDESAENTTTTKPAPADFITVNDKEGGFTIKHPKTWKSLRDPAGDERLLVSAGGDNYVRVRVVDIDPNVDLKAGIETGLQEEGVRVLKAQQITLGELPGLYYLYTFEDSETKEQAVHAHYFLVRGTKMYILVFQALPTEDFTRLAPVFDQVAETFRSTSDAPAPTPTSTTPEESAPESSTPETTPAPSSTTKP